MTQGPVWWGGGGRAKRPSTASFVAGLAPLVLYDGQSSGLPTRASLWLPRVTRGGVPARLSGAHRLDGCAREPGSG